MQITPQHSLMAAMCFWDVQKFKSTRDEATSLHHYRSNAGKKWAKIKKSPEAIILKILNIIIASQVSVGIRVGVFYRLTAIIRLDNGI